MINQSKNTVSNQSFIWQWSMNAPGQLLFVSLMMGIGAFSVPFSSFLLSRCLGVGADAIGWVMPIVLCLTGIGVGFASGQYIGTRQQEIIQHHFPINIMWNKSTQYGLMLGFAISGLLYLPLTHLLCPMDALCNMLCCFHTVAVLLPIFCLIMGISQWLSLRHFSKTAHHWLIVQVISASLVSGIIILLISDDINIRSISVVVIGMCVLFLRKFVDTAWTDIVKNLIGILATSKLLFIFGVDLLLSLGTSESTVDTTFLLIYLPVLVIVLTLFKAHIAAYNLIKQLTDIFVDDVAKR